MDTKKLEILSEIIRFQKSMLMPIRELAMASPAKTRKAQMAFDRFNKKVVAVLQEELNVDFLEYTGSLYEEGLPVDPMNIDDFEGVDNLVIASTLEPTIKERGTSTVLRNGKVILAEVK